MNYRREDSEIMLQTLSSLFMACLFSDLSTVHLQVRFSLICDLSVNLQFCLC